MRAVNLIPAEERRGGSARGGRAGASYLLLGFLAVLVLLVTAWALTSRTVDDRKAEVAQVTRQAAAAEAEAAALKDYTDFANLRLTRVETIAQLASTRFDWSYALRELARTIPARTYLTSLEGTSGGADGAAAPAATAPTGPSMQLVGCTGTASDVARMIVRMRSVDGVDRVRLVSSAAGEGGATAGAAAAGAGAATGGCEGRRTFELQVTFRPGDGPAAPRSGRAVASTTTTTGGTP